MLVVYNEVAKTEVDESITRENANETAARGVPTSSALNAVASSLGSSLSVNSLAAMPEAFFFLSFYA